MSHIVERIWAFLAVDGGNEGVIGIMGPDGWLPAVTTNEDLMRQMIPRIQEIVDDSGLTVRLIRMDSRVDLETLHPQTETAA